MTRKFMFGSGPVLWLVPPSSVLITVSAAEISSATASVKVVIASPVAAKLSSIMQSSTKSGSSMAQWLTNRASKRSEAFSSWISGGTLCTECWLRVNAWRSFNGSSIGRLLRS